MRNRRRIGGWSLVETIFVLLLVSLLLAVSLKSPAPSGSHVRAAAQMVFSQLCLAREQAVTRQSLVGFAFPRQGVAWAQSCYELQGAPQPRLQRSTCWDNTCSRAYLWAGFWGGAQVKPGVLSQGSYDISAWATPYPEDAVLAFAPGGQALSRLPLVDGAYRLVLGSAFTCEASSVDGQPAFKLTSVRQPITISITPGGAITLEEGLHQPSEASLNPVTAISHQSSPPRPLPQAFNQNPTGTLEVVPAPATELPPGVDATCRVGGLLTLKVSAQDPDGDPLHLEWSCDRGGGLSHPCQLPMTWKDGHWQAEWSWSPPPDTADGEKFQLTCRVADDRGGELHLHLGAAGIVQALNDGRIVFSSDRTGNFELYAMNSDGTDLIQLTKEPGMNHHWPRVSPDGRKVLFNSNRHIGSGWQTELFVMNSDGSHIRQITRAADAPAPGWSSCGQTAWSPDGTRILFSTPRDPVQHDIWTIHADGSGLQYLGQIDQPAPTDQIVPTEWSWNGVIPYDPANSAAQFLLAGNMDFDLRRFFPDASAPEDFGSNRYHVAVSPDLHWMAATGTAGIQIFPWTGLANTTPVTTVPGTETGCFYPTWSPDSSRLLFCRRVSATNADIYSVRRDGTELKRITNQAGWEDHPSWALNIP
ncbi:MAG: PD40 domain-containing protein [Candidatus Eremiobacteraeota bacterium]|nr:PD40 domain-containing protein [Candidatus Eremiobacteraeota bacterium]MCW5869289.1 PD40 domain-containing protein [Candidatus Eremiobacteraeota bacterium]